MLTLEQIKERQEEKHKQQEVRRIQKRNAKIRKVIFGLIFSFTKKVVKL